ncbi:MAG: hypothetical protein ACK41C_02265 [Phenylobacterium sp.]|uniref:hypothetical protein n=1 Tax=Phenylobacterium sp. TaxID=1871053 RepID=UPI00391986B3
MNKILQNLRKYLRIFRDASTVPPAPINAELELCAGVVNLADKKPATLDLLGRRFFIGLKARF